MTGRDEVEVSSVDVCFTTVSTGDDDVISDDVTGGGDDVTGGGGDVISDVGSDVIPTSWGTDSAPYRSPDIMESSLLDNSRASRSSLSLWKLLVGDLVCRCSVVSVVMCIGEREVLLTLLATPLTLLLLVAAIFVSTLDGLIGTSLSPVGGASSECDL